MSDREKFQSFLSQIVPMVKESGLPLEVLIEAVKLAFIQSGNEDWDKVDEYTEGWLKRSNEQLILIALTGIMKTNTPTTHALYMALWERAKLE